MGQNAKSSTLWAKCNLVHQFSKDPAFMEVLFKLTPVYTE